MVLESKYMQSHFAITPMHLKYRESPLIQSVYIHSEPLRPQVIRWSIVMQKPLSKHFPNISMLTFNLVKRFYPSTLSPATDLDLS